MEISVLHPVYEAWVPVILSDRVLADVGTGVLHIAPACSPIDLEIGLLNGLTSDFEMAADGSFIWENNIHNIESSIIVLQRLASQSRVLTQFNFSHLQPHCRYCNTKLVFRNCSLWSIDLSLIPQFKDVIAQLGNDQNQFFPKRSKKTILTVLQTFLDSKYWPIAQISDEDCTQLIFDPMFVQAVRLMRSSASLSKDSIYISSYLNVTPILGSFVLNCLASPTTPLSQQPTRGGPKQRSHEQPPMEESKNKTNTKEQEKKPAPHQPPRGGARAQRGAPKPDTTTEPKPSSSSSEAPQVALQPSSQESPVLEIQAGVPDQATAQELSQKKTVNTKDSKPKTTDQQQPRGGSASGGPSQKNKEERKPTTPSQQPKPQQQGGGRGAPQQKPTGGEESVSKQSQPARVERGGKQKAPPAPSTTFVFHCDFALKDHKQTQQAQQQKDEKSNNNKKQTKDELGEEWDCSPLSTLSPDLLRIWICCSKFTNEILYFNTKETQQDLMTATTFYHNLSSLLHGLRDLLSTPIPTTCDHDDVTLSVPSTTSSCCGRPPVEKVLSLSKSCLLSLTCLEKYILTEIHKTNTKIRTAYKTADLGALIYTLNGFMEMLKSLLPVLIVQMKSKEPLGYLFSVLTSLVYPIAPQLVSSIMDLSPSSLSSSMASSPLPFIQTSDTLLNKEKKNIWMSFSKFRDVVESLKKNSGDLVHLQLITPQRKNVDHTLALLNEILNDGELTTLNKKSCDDPEKQQDVTMNALHHDGCCCLARDNEILLSMMIGMDLRFTVQEGGEQPAPSNIKQAITLKK